MTKVHSWNEYDTLKTVILGSVYDNDRIPEIHEGYDQECFIKIVEQTNKELKQFQTILEQNGVNVLRPTQPKSYNGVDVPYHEPAINMRDFHMAYGEMFFMTYGPYAERRYYHLWIEDIVNQLILDNNLICNANELNFEPSIQEFDIVKKDIKRFFEASNSKRKFTKEAHIKSIINDPENVYLIPTFSWFMDHNVNYTNKNTFHTASILKHNNICFMSEFNGGEIGQKWITNWLKLQNIKPIIIPYVGHLDGQANILNKDTAMAVVGTESLIFEHFDNIIFINQDVNLYSKLRLKSQKKVFVPSIWLNKWQKLYKDIVKDVNSLMINPNLICLSIYDKDLYANLKNVGIDVIYVEWSNSYFWEGGLHCITCDIERRPE